MAIVDRIKSLFSVAEGSPRGPFYGMGELGGFHSIDPKGDGWHRNLEVSAQQARHIPAVYASVMLIAKSASQCYPTHVREVGNAPTHIKTSAAYRVLRNPNNYQSGSEFLLNLIATSLFEGESFALATRNDRNEITSLHILPRGACSPMIDDETRSIYYSVGSNPLAPGGADYVVPARDILHLKYHTPRHPLIGESPIKAAAMAAGVNVVLSKSQAAFFNRMNRPSGVLSTDMSLNAQQMQQLRAAFEEQSKSWATGGLPILGAGLKFQPMSISSQDAQLIQAQRMSIEDIARVFGVPTPLIGDLSHATLNNTESLISHFLSTSLGSYLEILERSLDRLFGLGNNEYIELDTTALLRTNMEQRINALAKAVQGGLMTPDEARQKEGLGPVEGGSEAFLQAQMVPVNYLAEMHRKTNEPQEPQATPEPQEVAVPEEGKDMDVDVVKALYAARRAERFLQ